MMSEFPELTYLRERIEFYVPSKAVSKKELVKISECAWPEISLVPRTILDIVVRPERERSLPPQYLEVTGPIQATSLRKSSSSSSISKCSDGEKTAKRRSFLGISINK